MSSPYLNVPEHNLRKPPRTSVIKQFAKALLFAASEASRQCCGHRMFAPARWWAVRPTIFRGLIAAVW
jgi:hypothetical protein